MTRKKILVVGGGTGGHTTPVVSVVKELQSMKHNIDVEFWTDRKQYKNVKNTKFERPVLVKRIISGKLRRFTNWNFWEYIKHFHIVLLNLIDLIKLGFGFIQSLIRLIFWRPNVIFLKGGYVCLPVGLAAGILKIPYVIHESDVMIGLTNRLLMRKAQKIATGMPVEYYEQFQEKMVWVGVPIDDNFRVYSEKESRELRKEFGFDEKRPLIVVTGGSQGAKNINACIARILPDLLKFTNVLLITGRDRYDEMSDLKQYEGDNFGMIAYSDRLWDMFGAATIVIARTGASTMMNLAASGKAAVLVPNQKLPGEHQVKNARIFVDADAGVMLIDKDMMMNPRRLLNLAKDLIDNDEKRNTIEKNVKKFTKRDATKSLAEMILNFC